MRNVKRDLALPAKKRWRAPDGARRFLHKAVKIDISPCHGPGGAPPKVCASKVSRGKGAAAQVSTPAAFLQKSRRKRCTACGGVVGLAGFEPTDAGVKVPCLTAWRQPSLFIEKSELFRVRFPCNVGWLVGLEPTASRATIWRASQLRHSHHILVRPEGLEPPAHCLEGSCSIHLSYGRLKVQVSAKRCLNIILCKGAKVKALQKVFPSGLWPCHKEYAILVANQRLRRGFSPGPERKF